MDHESELLGDAPVKLPRERDVPDPPKPPDAPDHESRPRSRARRHWWSLLALVLVVAAVGGYADGRERGREAAAVRGCESRLRLASDHADYRMGLTTNYVQSVGVPGTESIHIADLMAPRARRVLPAVQRAEHACEQVRVSPWHFSLVSRQHAATAYSDALVTLLQLVAAQGRVSFHGNATLQRLRDAVGLSGG